MQLKWTQAVGYAGGLELVGLAAVIVVLRIGQQVHHDFPYPAWIDTGINTTVLAWLAFPLLVAGLALRRRDTLRPASLAFAAITPLVFGPLALVAGAFGSSIMLLVVGAVFSVAGILLGVAAWRTASLTARRGRLLVGGGLWIAYTFVAMVVLGTFAMLLTFAII